MMEVLHYRIPGDALHDGYFLAKESEDSYVMKAFFWLFYGEYRKRIERLCPACMYCHALPYQLTHIISTMTTTHISSCLHGMEVVVDENLVEECMEKIDWKRLQNATLEIADLKGCERDFFILYDFELYISNVGDKEYSRAVNYQFPAWFNGLPKTL